MKLRILIAKISAVVILTLTTFYGLAEKESFERFVPIFLVLVAFMILSTWGLFRLTASKCVLILALFTAAALGSNAVEAGDKKAKSKPLVSANVGSLEDYIPPVDDNNQNDANVDHAVLNSRVIGGGLLKKTIPGCVYDFVARFRKYC